jgi:hypothetical protein
VTAVGVVGERLRVTAARAAPRFVR